jgi:CheY-like chemotaxis protein
MNNAQSKTLDKDTKILLVEDDRGHAELVKMNLERSGVKNEVIHFENGRHVVDFLLDNHVSDDVKYMMILDINMPGMNGLQVLDRIKNNQLTKSIPIIVLTTANDEKEIEYCYDLGCNVFITKPMDYNSFSQAMRDLGSFLKTARIQAARKPGYDQDNFVVYY